MTTADDGRDPFEGLTLDEAWATGAAVREPTAAERLAHAADERDRLEADEEAAARAWRRRRTRRRRSQALVLAGLLVFGAAVAVADRGGPPASTWAAPTDGGTARLTVDGQGPTARPSASSKPLGRPADPDATGGTFAFVATQASGTDPVTYDPCRPIEIVVDARSSPAGTAKIVRRAIDQVHRITGLTLTITGDTTEQPGSTRAAYQPERYGDRWAPVLLAWSDAERTPALAGDVAGLGGSVAIDPTDGPTTYVTGMVALDAPDIARILDEEDQGTRIVEDIVLHELAHVLGLAHVDSKAELMYPEGQQDLHGYQQGDLTGLSRLGQGTCVARL